MRSRTRHAEPHARALAFRFLVGNARRGAEWPENQSRVMYFFYP